MHQRGALCISYYLHYRVMPKSDTPKIVMHDAYVFLDQQERFQREMRCLNVARVLIPLFRSFELGLCWPLAFLSRIRGRFAELLLPLLHHEMILTSVF